MKPFLVPYLVEDQLAAKGNMIVIAGGGYSSRGNAMEGYPIAEAFQDLGYNAMCSSDGWPPTARKIPGWICSGLSVW